LLKHPTQKLDLDGRKILNNGEVANVPGSLIKLCLKSMAQRTTGWTVPLEKLKKLRQCSGLFLYGLAA
jgi:hypothetical protein